MSPPTSVLAQTSGGTMSAEESLIRELHDALVNCGAPIGCSKASRIVRQYTFRAQENGWELFDFVVNRLELTVDRQKRLATGWHRVISYLDPTGDGAVSAAMRDERYLRRREAARG